MQLFNISYWMGCLEVIHMNCNIDSLELLMTNFPLIFSRDQDMSWLAHYSMFYSRNDILQC